ncbi:biotin/lipoyl-containing protein [Shigella sonnei]
MVKVGDKVAAEQSLITEKAIKLLWSFGSFAGVVKELKVNVGDKAKTGSLITIFEVKAQRLRQLLRKQERQRRLRQQKLKPAAAPAAKAKGKSEFAGTTHVHATPLIAVWHASLALTWRK